MPDQFFQFVPIIRYALIFLGILGIIILITGFYRRDRKLKMRGAYFIILAVVLGICGYLIYDATIDRTTQVIYEMQQQYGY